MSSINGFGHLLAFILKRDKVWLPCWLLGIYAITVFIVPLMPSLAGDEEAKLALMQTLLNPAMIAMCGPSYGTSMGAIFAQFMLVWVVALVAVMNIMFVVRHTRKDEEEGRSELFGALPVGRNANLLAVLLAALIANLVLALLTSASLPLFAVESIDWTGSMVFGLAMAAGGFAFAALSAIFAQVLSTSRGVLGLSLAVLGGLYLLRAAGDMAVSGTSGSGASDITTSNAVSDMLAMLSPLGLVERSQVYVHNYIWPEIILIAVALLLCALAFVLGAMRSSGQGMLPARGGRAHASILLRGELGLAWRLSRSTIIAWAVVAFVFAAAYGSVFNSISVFAGDNEMYKMMLTGGMTFTDIINPIIAMLTLIMSIIAAIPVAQVALKLVAEEGRGRMEQLLAKSVSRYYLVVCYIAITFILAFVLQLLTALGMWIASSSVMSDPIAFEVFFACAMNFLPAVLVFAGLGLFFIGVAPKARMVIWVYLTYSFIVTYFGDMVGIAKWAQNISVFALLPRYPAQAIEPGIIIALCVVAVALAAVGITTYRRRDVAG
jgi:ABC-2 type transport system permease protein